MILDFEVEKKRLLSELDSEIKNNPENETLKSLNKFLKYYNSAFQLCGQISRLVIDGLVYKNSIGEKLIAFETYFSDISNSIKSNDLRRLATYLLNKKTEVTFFGNLGQ